VGCMGLESLTQPPPGPRPRWTRSASRWIAPPSSTTTTGCAIPPWSAFPERRTDSKLCSRRSDVREAHHLLGRLIIVSGGPSSSREAHHRLGRLIIVSGGSSSSREAHHRLGRLIIFSGGASSSREAHHLLGRRIIFSGGSSSSREAHHLLGKLIVFSGSSSSSREAHHLLGRLIIFSGGPSSSREAHRRIRSVIVGSGGASRAPDVPPGRPRFLARERGPAGARAKDVRPEMGHAGVCRTPGAPQRAP